MEISQVWYCRYGEFTTASTLNNIVVKNIPNRPCFAKSSYEEGNCAPLYAYACTQKRRLSRS